jgi:KipI family sensor histidine kinase inhibitor
VAVLAVTPVGERAWLVSPELPDEEAGRFVRSLYRRLLAGGVPGLVDVVPAARSLLVLGGPAGDLDAESLSRELSARAAEREPEAEPGGERLDVPFRPDGADLADVASRIGISVPAFLDELARIELTVAFLGFAPGFPYLVGLPAAWRLPRRDVPRPGVPAGSVAMAGPYAGIYPSETPGGWHLLGTARILLFDPSRDPPSRLSPGNLVRLVPDQGV